MKTRLTAKTHTMLSAIIITVFVLGLFSPGQLGSVYANSAQDKTPPQGEGWIEIRQGDSNSFELSPKNRFTLIGEIITVENIYDPGETAIVPNIVPPNDEISTPTLFSVLPGDFSQDVTDATQSLDDPDLTACHKAAGTASVWYKYTPSASGLVVMDTFDSDYDTMIGVWSGPVDGLTEVTCNDDYQSLDSLVAFQAVLGVDYYVGISKYNGGLSASEGSSAGINEIQAEKMKAQEISPDETLSLVFHADDSPTLTSYLMVSQVRDTVTGVNLMPSNNITLTIGGYSDTVSSTYGTVTFDLSGIVDIQPGDTVHLSDGYHPVSHEVRNLAFTQVNKDTNTVQGIADLGWDVFTYAHDPVAGVTEHVNVIPDDEGVWVYEFTEVDFVPGANGYADQCDAASNCTYDEWSIPDPHIFVYPQSDQVDGEKWTAYAEVTLMIDGVSMGSSIADKNGRVVFNSLPVNVKPGQLIKMSDEIYTRKHTVVNLSVTSIDKVKDKLTGTALPNTKVEVLAWPISGYSIGKNPLADALGNWKASFSGLVDIDTGTENSIRQCDAKGNCTNIYAFLFPKPGIYDPVLVGATATLKWEHVDGATQYKVQVARDASFTNLFFNGKINGNSYVDVSDLKAGKKYYWRVSAIREFTPKGPWSDTGTFTRK